VRVRALWGFCFRSLARNRMRSLLTSLGIIIGVGSVIVMVAVGDGSQAQISRQIASMGTNLLMVRPPRGPREANRLSQADVEKIRREASLLRAVSGQDLPQNDPAKWEQWWLANKATFVARKPD